MRGDSERRSRETQIEVCLRGEPGDIEVDTGVGFFDHLLTAMAHHGRFSLRVAGSGDLETGGHHLVEDTGLVMGEALSLALGDRARLERFGQATVPMDDALVLAAVDLGGRPYLGYALELDYRRWGSWETDLWPEFLRALTTSSGSTVHLRSLAGEDPHHMLEASAKALGMALSMAWKETSRGSTKGLLGGKGT